MLFLTSNLTSKLRSKRRNLALPSPMPKPTPSNPHRRDFLMTATKAMAAVPFIAGGWVITRSLGTPENIQDDWSFELKLLEPGGIRDFRELGQPFTLWRRTTDQLAAVAKDDDARFRDTIANNPLYPPETLAISLARSIAYHPAYILLSPVCTRLGCYVEPEKGDYGGWLCLCCDSHYDLAGRIRKGPAPTNLVIPGYLITEDGFLIIPAPLAG